MGSKNGDAVEIDEEVDWDACGAWKGDLDGGCSWWGVGVWDWEGFGGC